MGEVTTMKLGRDTRDRLRALSRDGDTLEDVVVRALASYESHQFWVEAEGAATAETAEQRAQRKRAEATIDGWLDDLR